MTSPFQLILNTNMKITTVLLRVCFFLLAFSSLATSQVLDPVKWKFEAEPISTNEYDLIFTANMDKGWTVYSQYTSDEGPVPTYLEYESNHFEKIGDAKESGKKKEGFDKLFEVNVIKFLSDEPYVIRQRIKTSDSTKPITGYVTYMTCDNNKCLPPTDVDFSISLPKAANTVKTSNTLKPQGQASAAPVEVQEPNKAVSVQSTPPATIGKVNMPATSITIANEEMDVQDQGSNILEPVKWSSNIEKTGEREFSLIFKATIDEGWTLYSQDSDPEGPIPTTLVFEESDGIELVGKAVETGAMKTGPEPVFDNVIVSKFLSSEPYTLTQKVKVKDASKLVKGYIESMTCDATKCIKNPDFNFGFDLENEGKSVGYDFTKSEAGGLANLASGDIPVLDQTVSSLQTTYVQPLSDCGKSDNTDEKNSLLWLLLAGILGGFAALLTPCVFPMIPITVSFFTKDTKRKGWVNGLIYGVSIIAIYVILGFLITILLGPEALNALSTNWIANTLFFIIFIVFAFSFFGFYEITLPSSWSTKSDRMADKGGLLGIFFMAATLALVSFSCTGPIVGSALVAAANGGIMGPLTVMLGFSAALALPFGLFAAFPAWLNSLPKSGGWMNSVKVVLGFLELGFAFKFLSTADLTKH